LGKKEDEAEKYAEGLVAPFRDKHGEFLKGQAFWNKQAELKAGVFAASNSMLLGNGNLFAGAISDSGMTGKVSSGVNTSKNNQYDEKTGKKFDAGVEGNINKNIDGATAAERARYAMNPKKWVEGIAAKGHDAGVEALQRVGLDKNEAEEAYSTLASPTVGVTGAVAIAEVMGRISGKGSIVGKTIKGTANAGARLFGRDEPFPKSPNGTISKAEKSNDPQSNSEINNKGQHNDSFYSNLSNSTTNKELLQEVGKKQANLDKQLDNGKISDNEWIDKTMQLDDLKDDISKGEIFIPAIDTHYRGD